MNEIIILSIVFLVIIIICIYFISRHKQQAIQSFTLGSFMNANHFNEEESQKQSIMNKINDFFVEDKDGDSDGFDDGDSDDGGE